MYYCFYCHLFLQGKKESGTPHPHTPSSPYIFSSSFFLEKNLGHMPQRNAKCFNSFAPFSLAAISKASFYAQKWFVQAGPSKQLWERLASLLWGEMTDNTGMVRGWKGTWLQFIWSENILFLLIILFEFINLCNKTQTDYTIIYSSFFFFFFDRHISASLSTTFFFQLPFSPSWAEHLSVTVRDQMRSRGCQQCNKIPRGMVGTDV